MTSTRKGKSIKVILANGFMIIIFIAMAMDALVLGVQDTFQVWDSASWEKSQADIVAFKFEENIFSETSYRVEISYSFSHQGVLYTGNRYEIPKKNYSYEERPLFLQPSTTIYFNPKNPEQSCVVQPKWDVDLMVMIGIRAFIFVLFSILSIGYIAYLRRIISNPETR